MATARATSNHRARTDPRSQPGAATAGTATAGTATAGIARQTRDQVVSTIQQGHQVSIEDAQTWVEALSMLPLRAMPKVPGFLTFPMGAVEAVTNFYFDVAVDLLNAQREYTLQLVRLFSSKEPAE